MRYTTGSLGRVFVLKFDNDDIVIDELVRLAAKERIRSAAFVFIGALRKGDLVTGPKRPVIPPEPNWVGFDGAWEAMGIGTLFTGKKGPQIHIHTSMGKRCKVLTGCLRKDSKVFLVIEAIVFELKGVKAAKEIDPRTGLNLLRVGTVLR